jgi:hypothetical protein
MHGEVIVKLYAFLSSALYGGEWLASCSRMGLDMVVKREIPALLEIKL